MSRRPVPASAACAISACHSRGRPGLVLADLSAVLVERAGQLESGTFPGGDRREPCDPAVPSGAGPGQPGFRGNLPPGGERSVRPVFPVGGGWRSGQAAGRGLLQQAGRQRPGVAEPGGVHGRGEDRLAARVASGIGVAAQQPGNPGQVLGDLSVRPAAAAAAASTGSPLPPASASSAAVNRAGTSKNPPP